MHRMGTAKPRIRGLVCYRLAKRAMQTIWDRAMSQKQIDKNKVGIILNGLGAIADRPMDKKGNLDVKAFNGLPEVKKAVNKLKELGVNKKWLREHYQIAALLLKI